MPILLLCFMLYLVGCSMDNSGAERASKWKVYDMADDLYVNDVYTPGDEFK